MYIAWARIDRLAIGRLGFKLFSALRVYSHWESEKKLGFHIQKTLRYEEESRDAVSLAFIAIARYGTTDRN